MVQGDTQNDAFSKQWTGQPETTTAVAAPLFPEQIVSFASFRFPRDFSSICAAILPLKKMNLAVKKREIPPIVLTHLLKLCWRDWKKEKEDQAKATAWQQNRKIIALAFE